MRCVRLRCLHVPYAQTALYDGPQRYQVLIQVHDDDGPISRLVEREFAFTATPR